MTAIRIFPLLLLTLFFAPAPAHANWLSDKLHNAGSWLQDKGSSLVSDSRERMNSGNIFNKILGAGERVVGEIVKAAGKVVDWFSRLGGRDQGVPALDPDSVSFEDDGGLPPGPDGKALGGAEAAKAQRDIGGDGNGEARGTGGADGEGKDPEGQTDEDARWEPGQGGAGGSAVGTSRFGKKEMDFNATQTAAKGVVIPGFSAGAVCVGAACGKSSGKGFPGEPSLGGLLRKGDVPAGFGAGKAGGSGARAAMKPVDVKKTYEPAFKVQGEAPPLAAPAEEKKSWFSSLVSGAKNAVVGAGKAVASAGKAAAGAAVSTVGRVHDALADARMAVVDAAYQKTLDVVNPLREKFDEGSLPRKLLDRVRLEALKKEVTVVSARAKDGNNHALERLNDVYENDIEREDWQPVSEQKKEKALTLALQNDADIVTAQGNWRNLDEQQRQATLQRIADLTSEHYGLQSYQVQYEAMPCDNGCTFGYYNGAGIYINSDPKVMGDLSQVSDTVVHELTHAYQDKLTSEPPKLKISLSANENDQRTILKANEDFYLSPGENFETFDDYYNQPMERHARQAGGDITAGIGDWELPDDGK